MTIHIASLLLLLLFSAPRDMWPPLLRDNSCEDGEFPSSFINAKRARDLSFFPPSEWQDRDSRPLVPLPLLWKLAAPPPPPSFSVSPEEWVAPFPPLPSPSLSAGRVWTSHLGNSFTFNNSHWSDHPPFHFFFRCAQNRFTLYPPCYNFADHFFPIPC